MIINILFFIPGLALSQDYNNFNTVDKETYQLYIDKDWDLLIDKGNQAIKSGIDYYFLRMRLGIAFYEKHNYIKASSHFKKALEYNEGDPVALEYLFYSCLFTGKDACARFISKDFNDPLRAKTGTSTKKYVDNIKVEYLYNNCLTDNIISEPDNYFPYIFAGYQIVTRNFHNFSLSASHPIGHRFSLFHGYTYLHKTNLYHYNDGIYILNNPEYTIRQHQYYITFNTTFQGDWMISPSIHILTFNYPLISSISTGGPGSLRVTYTPTNDYNFITGLSVSKSAGLIDIRFATHYTFLNDKEHIQNLLGLTLFPLGNLNLYLGGDIASNIELISKTEIQPVFNAFFGFSLFEKIWVEFSGTTGEIQNFTESNGYYVYNSLDAILQKANITVLIPVTQKGSSIYLGSKIARYESQLYPFSESVNSQSNKIHYNSYSIYGGVSWKF